MRPVDLRDHFAGQALTGLISQTPDEDGQWTEKAAARLAYAYADAMMVEREKTKCSNCQATLRPGETTENCPTCEDIRAEREEGGAR